MSRVGQNEPHLMGRNEKLHFTLNSRTFFIISTKKKNLGIWLFIRKPTEGEGDIPTYDHLFRENF